MKRLTFPAPVHKPFCFAGQPAPCPGYFENDVLPCVCGATQDVLSSLEQVQVPVTPVVKTGRRTSPRRRGRRSLRLEPQQPRCQEPGAPKPAMWKQAG